MTTAVLAQRVRATRPDGSAVWLNPNGTWEEAVEKTVAASGAARTKPASATETQSLLKNASLSYDPTKWRAVPNQNPGRFNFTHANGDGYALVIAERIQMEPEALVALALQNAKAAAPDAHFVLDEKRMVNATPVRCLQIVGTMQSIGFKYFGYYYAGPAGTVQVITYTSTNLFDEFAGDFQALLDGFAVTP